MKKELDEINAQIIQKYTYENNILKKGVRIQNQRSKVHTVT